jgi:hypothetical protein
MPKTDDTIEYFKRYSEFYLSPNNSTCWRVVGVDDISTPNILEINAVEYYRNDTLDNNGIVDDLIVEPVIENVTSEIEGEVFIKPKTAYSYSCAQGGEWSIVEKDFPVVLSIRDSNNVTLKWDRTYSG